MFRLWAKRDGKKNRGVKMLEELAKSLIAVNKEIAVIVLSALPVSELRGGIPLGIALGFSPLKSYILALIGNFIPVIPLLCFLQPLVDRFRHIGFVQKFFDWFFERTRKKATLVEKFEALGLILFVAIPLPITGAWTGCVAATLFKIRFRYALLAVTAGIIIAGFIVLGVSWAGKEILINGS